MTVMGNISQSWRTNIRRHGEHLAHKKYGRIERSSEPRVLNVENFKNRRENKIN